MLQPLNHRIQCRRYRVNRRLVGSQGRSRRFEGEICLSGEERLRRSYSARSLVTTTTTEPRLMRLIMLSYVIRKMSLNELHALYAKYLSYVTIWEDILVKFCVRIFLIGVHL
jgi:hypothetical protein